MRVTARERVEKGGATIVCECIQYLGESDLKNGTKITSYSGQAISIYV
jgi:hypothetical protein